MSNSETSISNSAASFVSQDADPSMLLPTRPLLSWSKTLHLPRSTLPARPPLPSPYLKQSTDELYAWQQRTRTAAAGHGQFVLHDGPPYANGELHVGHALNKILKDIICRFEVARGKRVSYVPGWDCHGLPIEVKALQALHTTHDALTPAAVRQAARRLAERTVEIQRAGFREWAVMGEWESAWRTMDQSYVLRQLGIFKEMVDKGLIAQEFKPVYWSPSSGTALAEAELEYDDNHKSTAAFVRCPVVRIPESITKRFDLLPENLGLLIWTTTPWTLPANLAIACHKDLEYCVVTLGDGTAHQMILAKSRLEYLRSVLGNDISPEIVADGILGSELTDGTIYRNPCGASAPKRVYHADWVSSESGSGLVHMAPGHGMDDYNLCQPLGIPAFAPVDDKGRFTANTLPNDDAMRLTGKDVLTDGTRAVLDLLHSLEQRDTSFGKRIIAEHDIIHKYPIDWRTKEPVIIRATKQWFADVGSLKGDALKSLENVEFIPDTSRTRLESFTKSRSQWCISRQRAWGVPIPTLYRITEHDREAVMNGRTIDHILKRIEERGIDAWFNDAPDEAAWIPDWLPAGRYERGRDTMDVWFDSGTSWTLLQPRENGEALADVYLEGSDQHRGWFQSSLLAHIAHQQAFNQHPPKAPFRKLITHGFTLDQDLRKMSKSIGNTITPDEIINGTLLPPMKSRKQQEQQHSTKRAKPIYDSLGPDALRLWVASSDYTRDVIIGQLVLQSVYQSLHKYRVTFKWLLGALSDYHPSTEQQLLPNPNELVDTLALYQLQKAEREVYAYFAKYEFFKAVNAINRYVNLDLSAFYFETLKDRLYTGSREERLPAQRVLYEILNKLLVMLGPITPLLAAEVWDHAPAQIKSADTQPLRRVWRLEATGQGHEKPEKTLQYLQRTNEAIKLAQEVLRAKKLIGSGLESDVHILLPTTSAQDSILAGIFKKDMETQLAALFVVSRVVIHQEDLTFDSIKTNGAATDHDFELDTNLKAKIRVVKPVSHKCARCWRYLAPQGAELCVRCDDVVHHEHPDQRRLVEQQ